MKKRKKSNKQPNEGEIPMKQWKKAALLGSLLPLAMAARDACAKSVAESARSIPVAHEVDVLVVGGNSAGVAAAIAAKKLGSRVLIVSPQGNFSYEVSATKRHWLGPNEKPESALAIALFGNRNNPSGYMAFDPGPFKKKVDDALMQAGVLFYFNCYPVGIVEDGSGKLAGIVMANKAGRQVVTAKVIIDATSMAGVARLAGAEMTAWKQGSVSVARTAQVNGDDRTYTGYKTYTSSVTMNTGSWAERCEAEMTLRAQHDTRTANWAADYMHMIEQSAIVGRATDNSSPWAGAKTMNLGCCQPKNIDHLYVTGTATSMSRANAEKLCRPLALIDLGERVGAAAHSEAQSRGSLSGLRIKTASGTDVVSGVDTKELLDGHRPGWSFDKLDQAATHLPVWGEYDVVVAGGGTAGGPAAISAARAGAKTLCIEMLGLLGGTSTNGIGKYWKGYRQGFTLETANGGSNWESCEKADWLFDQINAKNGDVWFNTCVCGAVMDGNIVKGVVVATPMGRGVVLAKRVIDATGDGDLCAHAGASYVYMVNEHDFAIQEASLSGDYRDPSGYRNDGENVFTDPMDIYGHSMFRALSRKYGMHSGRWDFYPLALCRETRHIVGDYTVSVLDEAREKNYFDVISQGKSDFDSHGYYWANECFVGVFPHGYAKGPYRALLPQGLENILVAGRCKSVGRDALPLTRMQPNVQNEGYASGFAAAQSIKDGVTARAVNIDKVQAHLIAKGNIPAEFDNHKDTPAPTDAELQAAADNPYTYTDRTYQDGTWLKMHQDKNLLNLLAGGKRSIPFLKASFEKSNSMQKAKLLCLFGDNSTVSYLANWLNGQKVDGSNGRPYFRNTMRVVSEVDGVMWALGETKDERAVDVLTKKLAACTDGNVLLKDSCFSHVRTIAISLHKIGSNKASAALKAFLDRPGVSGHVKKASDTNAHGQGPMAKAMVELYVASALYKCGDINNQAKTILTNYVQNDWRGPLVRYAAKQLGMDVAGSDPVISANQLAVEPARNIRWARIQNAHKGYTIDIALERPYDVNIYDMSGAVIKTFSGTKPAQYRMEPSALASGIHVVKISSGTKQMALKAAIIE
jgi:flavin-dependent dehydrogenase